MAIRSYYLLAGMFSALGLWGQSLHVALSQTDRNRPGIFTVEIDSPPGRAPAPLQWEFLVPPALSVQLADITIGKAAQAAWKTLTCAANSKQTGMPGAVRYACIVAGGREPLGSGALTEVHYRAQADVGGAPVRVAIQRVQAVSADVKPLAIGDAEAIIHIQ